MAETDINSLKNELGSFVERYESEILGEENLTGKLCLHVKPGRIKEMIRFLKESPETDFSMMMDLFGMDYSKFEPKQPERFAIIYNLFSLSRNSYLILKAFLPEESPEIESIHNIYRAADWFEREAYDLYGVIFIGHPNLTRILCHSDFEGHPLRKDYPSDGYQSLKNALPSSGF